MGRIRDDCGNSCFHSLLLAFQAMGTYAIVAGMMVTLPCQETDGAGKLDLDCMSFTGVCGMPGPCVVAGSCPEA